MFLLGSVEELPILLGVADLVGVADGQDCFLEANSWNFHHCAIGSIVDFLWIPNAKGLFHLILAEVSLLLLILHLLLLHFLDEGLLQKFLFLAPFVRRLVWLLLLFVRSDIYGRLHLRFRLIFLLCQNDFFLVSCLMLLIVIKARLGGCCYDLLDR